MFAVVAPAGDSQRASGFLGRTPRPIAFDKPPLRPTQGCQPSSSSPRHIVGRVLLPTRR